MRLVNSRENSVRNSKGTILVGRFGNAVPARRCRIGVRPLA